MNKFLDHYQSVLPTMEIPLEKEKEIFRGKMTTFCLDCGIAPDLSKNTECKPLPTQEKITEKKTGLWMIVGGNNSGSGSGSESDDIYYSIDHGYDGPLLGSNDAAKRQGMFYGTTRKIPSIFLVGFGGVFFRRQEKKLEFALSPLEGFQRMNTPGPFLRVKLSQNRRFYSDPNGGLTGGSLEHDGNRGGRDRFESLPLTASGKPLVFNLELWDIRQARKEGNVFLAITQE